MRYILDFDDTLFDTAGFKRWLRENELDGPRDEALLNELKGRVKKGTLDMKQFVFPDARDFLETNAKDSMIVSSFVSKKDDNNEAVESDVRAFQEFKLQASGIAEVIENRYELVAGSKIAAVSKELSRHPDELFMFVDDHRDYLEELEGLSDNLDLVNLRRESNFNPGTIGVESEVRFNTISDFSMLEHVRHSKLRGQE